MLSPLLELTTVRVEWPFRTPNELSLSVRLKVSEAQGEAAVHSYQLPVELASRATDLMVWAEHAEQESYHHTPTRYENKL